MQYKKQRRELTARQGTEPMVSIGYLNLAKSMRNLMAQFAYLTRIYFTSIFSQYGDDQAIADKLYSLPNRFQEKAELIFGAPLSEEFLNVFSLQIFYILSLGNAMAAGDQETADYYTQLLYENADAMAAQYAKMNPFWDEMQWKTLLYNYINLIIQDAVATGSREFEKELDIFERMLLASLAMGDYLADGFYQYMVAGIGHDTAPTPKPDAAS
ncbi:MAG TPA: hypothetical protein PKA19_14105 [Bacillota bacterium]|nr:hypothetical protein [Bacillota bacterium]